MTDNPPAKMYVNQIVNRITFRIKTGYYLKLLTPETLKLCGSTKSKIANDENGENAPRIEINEVVLFNNDHEQDSRDLYIFVFNKSFGHLIDISSKNFMF